MDWLEATKKTLHDNEAITNEVAAQAHLENWALKLFLYADKNDRAANFNKNVVQSFYTAQVLYDVLTLFGELSVEASQNRKYAQWKAAYIHNCLANGETPVPGPMKEGNEEDEPVEPSNDGKFTIHKILMSLLQILTDILWLLDQATETNSAPESNNDTPQNVPPIPTSAPATGIQSFDSDNTVYKTEGKSIYKYSIHKKYF